MESNHWNFGDGEVNRPKNYQNLWVKLQSEQEKNLKAMKKTNRMLGEILGLLRGRNIADFYAQRYTWIDNFDAQIEDNQEDTRSAELEDPKGKLLKLSQTDSVVEYQAAFEDIRSHVTEVPEAVLISLYISGSELAIREGLQLNRPTTLTKAFELAREFEKNYQYNKTEVQGRFQEHCDMVASAVHGHLILRHPQDISTRIGVELNSLIMIEVGPKFVGVSQYHNNQLAHVTQLLMCSLSKGHESHQMQDKWPISQEDAMVTLFCKINMLCHCWGDIFLKVSRRLVIFSLYALEEVYKEFLSLHLEDKVVLKGRRVDTIMEDEV